MKFNKQLSLQYFKQFYASVLKINLTASHATNIEFLLTSIENDERWEDIRQVSYFLATILHETGHTFAPVRERMAAAGTRVAELQAKYKPWYGRGYVQITWKSNYIKMGNILGIDLVTDPDVALSPSVSYEIAATGCLQGSFTGKKLSDYINSAKCDFVNARRVVNGIDRAEQIADYAVKINKILVEAVIKDQVVTAQPQNNEFFDIGSLERPIEANPVPPAQPSGNTAHQDPVVITPHTQEVDVKDWKTIAKKIATWLGFGGLAGGSGSQLGWFDGFKAFLSVHQDVIVLGFFALIALGGFSYAGYRMWKSYMKLQQDKLKLQLTLEELKIRSDPNRYNVEVEKK